MDFDRAVAQLNSKLEELQPETFSSSWIFKHLQTVYHYFRNNIRTEDGGIDWDTITSSLDRAHAKRWSRYRLRVRKQYSKQEEVDKILIKYQKKLYIFIAPQDEHDRNLRNRIIIRLVRVSQRGNIVASNEIVRWVRCVVDEWIDKYYQIHKWKGYQDEIDQIILGCTRRYRYTGSFLGYLFKTLEYSARGKPVTYSLDDNMFDGEAKRVDFIVQETEEERYKHSSY